MVGFEKIFNCYTTNTLQKRIQISGESQNGCYKKTKHAKFSKKKHFLPPDTHT